MTVNNSYGMASARSYTINTGFTLILWPGLHRLNKIVLTIPYDLRVHEYKSLSLGSSSTTLEKWPLKLPGFQEFASLNHSYMNSFLYSGCVPSSKFETIRGCIILSFNTTKIQIIKHPWNNKITLLFILFEETWFDSWTDKKSMKSWNHLDRECFCI